MAFKGWPAEALEFFEGLEADNSKAYWQDHKHIYEEQVRAPMEELLRELVRAEQKIQPRTLVAGIPARVVRVLSEQELSWKTDNMHIYQDLAKRSATTMREVEALTAVEPGRKRIEMPGVVPLSELKKGHG